MKSFRNIIRILTRGLNVVSSASLVMLMVLVTLNVILRTVFKSPILGTYDMTGFLTTIVIGCGLAFCSLENGHIEISFFVDKLGHKVRRWFHIAGQAFSFLFLSVYTYALFSYGSRLMRANEVSVTMKVPLHYFVYLLALCFCVFTFTVFLKIIEPLLEGAHHES